MDMATSALQRAVDETVTPVLTDLGVDTDGRSHHWHAGSERVVVCATDRRGRGIRDCDVAETIPAGGNGPREYTWFVHHEVDGVEWRNDK